MFERNELAHIECQESEVSYEVASAVGLLLR